MTLCVWLCVTCWPADQPLTSGSTVTTFTQAVDHTWANVQTGHGKTKKRINKIFILIQKGKKNQLSLVELGYKQRLTCSMWRDMGSHGRSCLLRFHSNPLCTVRSGPRPRWTDSSWGQLDEGNNNSMCDVTRQWACECNDLSVCC